MLPALNVWIKIQKMFDLKKAEKWIFSLCIYNLQKSVYGDFSPFLPCPVSVTIYKLEVQILLCLYPVSVFIYVKDVLL